MQEILSLIETYLAKMSERELRIVLALIRGLKGNHTQK